MVKGVKMEKKCTRKYDKLPSISGTPFSGFEDIVIESRQIVENRIINFIKYCKNDAEGVSARFILGEWGEGKTDSYNRLIRPTVETNDDYIFFVSASRLSNSYGNESLMNFAKFDLREDARFFVHLFNSIKSGLDDDDDDRIPEFTKYKNPKSYLAHTLEDLLQGSKNKKIYIFIDEFEELLSNTRILRRIISGLKEAINGEYKPLSKDGEYEGCLHFFIACTPESYYKIQVHDDTKGVMGGFDRRINKIALPEITKKEGIEYLFALLNYSYNKNLPKPLPIADIALFNTILRVCHGNLGVLTSLFTDILINIPCDLDTDKIQVLDYLNLINYFKNTKINVFGAQTPCIETDNYEKITKNLKEQSTVKLGETCNNVFNLLLGNLKPFEMEEICEKFDINKIDVTEAISVINQELNDIEKIDNSIIKLSPLKNELTTDELEHKLEKRGYIRSSDEKKVFFVPRSGYEEPLETFIDRITFVHLDKDNRLYSSVYLPRGSSISTFFNYEVEGFEDNIDSVFESVIDNIDYYIASDSLLNQIYPTPVPPELIYFTDKMEKLKLWRFISTNLRDQYEKNILESFIKLLNDSKEFEINYDMAEKIEDGYVVEVHDNRTNTKIKTLFYIVNGDVKTNHLNELNNILYENLDIHMALLLYNGDITEDATDILISESLSELDRLIEIPLHASLTKKMLFGFNSDSTKKYKKFIDIDVYHGICEKLVNEDLNFHTKIQNWIKIQRDNGLVIEELPIESTNNIKEFGDGLKFYLNYDGTFTPQEIHKKNIDGILRYKKYNAKGFVAADLEDSPNKFEAITKDLVKNGFLIEDNGLISIKENPVSKRIIEILKRKNSLGLSNLKSCFIIKDRKEKTFESVFTNILQYKGLITKTQGKNPIVNIQEKNKALKELKQNFNKYKESLNNSAIKSDAHFYERKKYAGKLIMLNEFNHFLQERYDEVLSTGDEEKALLKINICNKLIDQFDEFFRKSIETSSAKQEKLIEDLDNKKHELDEIFEKVLFKSRRWLKMDFKEDNIFEYSILRKELDNVLQISKKNYSKGELEKEIEKFENSYYNKYNTKQEARDKMYEIFDFNKSHTTYPYFNFKFYIMKVQYDKLEGKISSIKNEFERILIKFDEIDTRNEEVQSELKEIESIGLNTKIALYLFKKLKKALTYLDGDVKTINYELEVADLVDKAEKRIKNIREKIKLIDDSTSVIKNLNQHENKFLSKIKDYENDYNNIREKCDIDRLNNDIKRFSDKLEENEIKYNNMDIDQFLNDNGENSGRILDSWLNDVLNIKTAIEFEWDDFTEEIVKSIFDLERIISILIKKEDLKDNKEINELKYDFNQLKDVINNKIDYSTKNASELKESQEKINNKARIIIRKYLPDDALLLFETIESLNTKWIDVEKISEIVKERYNLDSKRLDDALNYLVEKGYMQKAFSLTI